MKRQGESMGGRKTCQKIFVFIYFDTVFNIIFMVY